MGVGKRNWLRLSARGGNIGSTGCGPLNGQAAGPNRTRVGDSRAVANMRKERSLSK